MRHLLFRLIPILFILAIICYLLDLAGVWTFLSDEFEREELFYRINEHMFMVMMSIGLAIVTGLLIGFVISRPLCKRIRPYVLYIVGLGQIIPTLAIVALSMSLFGIGQFTAIFTLYVISIIPIVQNTLTGLAEVSVDVLNAAKGIGLRKRDILLQVEIPIAAPYIFIGIRVAFIYNIGTATLGYLIGAGGLGEVIFTAIAVQETDRLLAGTVSIMLLAIIIDRLIGYCSNLLISDGLKTDI